MEGRDGGRGKSQHTHACMQVCSGYLVPALVVMPQSLSSHPLHCGSNSCVWREQSSSDAGWREGGVCHVCGKEGGKEGRKGGREEGRRRIWEPYSSSGLWLLSVSC